MRSFRKHNLLADTEQRYNFICPNCSGNFSIQIDRIPPVQARFRCPHCNEPMDFPSRDEARKHIRLQAEVKGVSPPAPASASPDPAEPAAPDNSPEATAAEQLRFRLDKPGFESDVFDRKGIRNLIRTREVLETDWIRVDDSGPVAAGSAGSGLADAGAGAETFLRSPWSRICFRASSREGKSIGSLQ